VRLKKNAMVQNDQILFACFQDYSLPKLFMEKQGFFNPMRYNNKLQVKS